MFASFFLRLFFAILLFLIASKKGYQKLIWAGVGFVLGPIALLVIILYRKNANYSRAFVSGITGVLIGAVLVLLGWFLYPVFSSTGQAQMVNQYADIFWVLILPSISLALGVIFFSISLVRNRGDEKRHQVLGKRH